MALGRNPVDGLMREYDRVIDMLIKRLRDLLVALGNERAHVMKSMRDEIQQINDAKKQEFENKKMEFYEKQKEGFLRTAQDNVMSKHFENRIKEIEEELNKLLEEDIKLSEQERITLASEEKMIEDDIKKISQLIAQIETKIGGRKKYEIKIFGKGKNTIILTPEELKQIYEQIMLIYQDLEKRGQKEQIIKTRIEPMKKQIEEKADDLISRLVVVVKGGTTPR